MATKTVMVFSFDDGKSRIEMDYDDITLKVITLRTINKSKSPMTVEDKIGTASIFTKESVEANDKVNNFADTYADTLDKDGKSFLKKIDFELRVVWG